MTSNGVSVDYLSTGANRQTAVADWSRAGLVAFGADCNIALWHPTDVCGVTRLLSGHKETVKAVAFLPQAENDAAAYLISGSDDRTLVVWKAPVGGQAFEPVQTCSDHAGPINCISALRVAQDREKWIVATGAADATVRIWCFENDRLRPLQTIQTSPKYFPLALSLSRLGADGDAFVLASAGTRDTVQILTAVATEELDTIEFSLQATLSGHEGWIRSLSFTRESGSPDSDVLLASASQDKYVRIWRIHQGRELPAPVVDGSDPSSDAFLPGKSPSNKAHWLKAAGSDFSVTFEALLLGHEDWIYSAKWFTQADGRLQLLSTSADNSLAIWEADPTSGIWVSMARLGEISREKGATTATGSTGGFWTGLWSPDGKSVACLGRTGSWRRWEYEEEQDSWRPCLAISGHTKAVTGISWAKSGSYLLSTSSDQTTRLHMQWKRSNEDGDGEGSKTWHEMSRPQIHGYDLNCIDSLGDFQFVSGADEKLMRVFSEPRAVAGMLSRLGDVPDPSSNSNLAAMPDAANMPVLGLSNKAIDTFDDDDDNNNQDQDQIPARNSNSDRDAIDPASVVKRGYLDIHHPPLEETLSRHTLWPETEKLYGHGYEISCLAASHDGTLVASACKASSLNHAVIRLFETQNWTELKPPLAAHSLTATRVRFSPDDGYLLSVGRDRQWAVFSRVVVGEGGGPTYELLQANPKGHSRMILDAAWAPSERPLFATAGRDKQVRIWRGGSDDGRVQFQQASACACEAPVTAVDFLPRRVEGNSILAIGTEAGRISLCLVGEDGSVVRELTMGLNLPKAVLQLAWRPVGEGVSRYELAVAGEDSSLRIYSFDGEMLR